ncbi:MAG: hypothetical protein K8S20_05950 [Chloroflexi bacterium]|nr:hypothetical protein [Chloroflexota bacterium]
MQNKEKGAKRKENKWLADRSGGIYILLISCGVAFFTIITPLRAVLNHSENVLYSSNLITWTVLGILFGLSYSILGGEALGKLIAPTDSKGVIRLVVFSIVFFGILFGFMAAWSAWVGPLGSG